MRVTFTKYATHQAIASMVLDFKKLMKQTVTFGMFLDSFSESRTGQFSYEGKQALYDYLEDYEEQTGEQVELDPIALCVEYTEYNSAWDAMQQYQPDDMPTVESEDMDLVEVEAAQQQGALEWLEEHTQVIPVGDTGRVIVLDF